MKSLTMQGCAYNINNDRVILSIDCISNNRPEGNISGTLRIDFCALPSNANQAQPTILAGTYIGELLGQHFLNHCQYDLLFQQPNAGSWELFLQLSEWDGHSYSPIDKVDFSLSYIVETTPQPTLENSSQSSQSADSINLEAPDDYEEINRVKSKTLRALKGVQKKVLEKLIGERPFRSKQAILNVKGVGPKVLDKIISQLSKEK